MNKHLKHSNDFEHIIMTFFVTEDQKINFSDELSTFLSVKSGMEINAFKSLFVKSSQDALYNFISSKKNIKLLVELLEQLKIVIAAKSNICFFISFTILVTTFLYIKSKGLKISYFQLLCLLFVNLLLL